MTYARTLGFYGDNCGDGALLVHGVGCFDLATGEFLGNEPGSSSSSGGDRVRWWELYPSDPCPQEPPWDLVRDAFRAGPPENVIDWLTHLAGIYGYVPEPSSIWLEPRSDEAPYMQRLVTASLSERGGRCSPIVKGSLADYARRIMWNAIDAYRGTPTGDPTLPATSPEEPGYEEQHDGGRSPWAFDPIAPLTPLDVPRVTTAGSSSKWLGIALAALAVGAIASGRFDQ